MLKSSHLGLDLGLGLDLDLDLDLNLNLNLDLRVARSEMDFSGIYHDEATTTATAYTFHQVSFQWKNPDFLFSRTLISY